MPLESRSIVRTPRAAVVAMVLWLLLFEAFGIAAIARRHYAGGALLIVIWWPFLIPVLRSLRNEVGLEGDELVAHGYFRRRRWRREDVAALEVVRPSRSPNFAYLELRTRDGGRFRLPGTAGSPWLWDRRRRDRQLAELTAWLAGPAV